MIQIDNFPTQNHVFLDANNTKIAITSSNGVGFYFRAKIFIDDQLFDEQSWSRKNDVTAEKDLKKLYYAYYETLFNSNFINGLEQQTHLIKKVSILISEFSIGDDVFVQSQNLPDFYLMYSDKSAFFNDNIKVQILGVNPDIIQIPKNGKLSIPFMVNANNEILELELKDNLGNIIDSNSKPAFTATRVYQYKLDLATVNLAANTLYFTLKITVGATTIIKNIRLFSAPKFEIKEVAFLNSFGYWLYAYLDGQLTIDNNLDIKTYEENQGTEKVYEINEKFTYTLNTGALLPSEKDIINQICTALDAKIYLNSKYITMVTTTKKVNVFKDRKNLYSENLSFSVTPENDFENI